MKIEKINLEGKKSSVEVKDSIFSSKINEKLISSVIYKTNANYKGRSSKTKQKNEIIGSTSKIYAQKGTGNARHASRKAPIFVGGGIAHGPKGRNSYKTRKLNKNDPIRLINVIGVDTSLSILKNLNIKFAWIVNSEDGMDEISPYAKTNVIQLKNGEISEIIIDPTVLNINAEKFDNLVGDDANYNASKIIEIFKGKDNDFSKAVCLNAAAGLVVGEKFSEFSEAYNSAREFILSGKTFTHLEKIQNVWKYTSKYNSKKNWKSWQIKKNFKFIREID